MRTSAEAAWLSFACNNALLALTTRKLRNISSAHRVPSDPLSLFTVYITTAIALCDLSIHSHTTHRASASFHTTEALSTTARVSYFTLTTLAFLHRKWHTH
jgi:hypothetical protein